MIPDEIESLEMDEGTFEWIAVEDVATIDIPEIRQVDLVAIGTKATWRFSCSPH